MRRTTAARFPVLLPAVLTLCLAALLAGPARAQAPVVAAVDLGRLINEAPQAAQLQQRLAALQQELQAEIDERQAVVERLQGQLQELAEGTDAYTAKQDELLMEGMSLQAFQQFQQNRFQREDMAGFIELYRTVRLAIRAVAEQQGIDIVVQYSPNESLDGGNAQQIQTQILTRIVLYVSEPADISDEVLTQLGLMARE